MKHVARFTVFCTIRFARQSRSRKLRRQLLVTKEKRWRFMRLDPFIPKTLQVAVLPGPGVVSWMSTRKPVGLGPREWRRARGSKFLDDAAIAAFSRWRFDQALFGKCTPYHLYASGEIRRAYQTLQPTAPRCAFTFFMTKQSRSFSSLAPGTAAYLGLVRPK